MSAYFEGDDHFFGDSIFENEAGERRAFISNYQELGYYKRDLLTVLLPKQKAEAFRIDPATYTATPAALDPELLKETIAYYPDRRARLQTQRAEES